ncbi:MAG: four helix bundle protein [Planctomycetota bacterium]
MSEIKPNIQNRTFNFATDIVRFYFSLENHIRLSAPAIQLLRSGTSIGTNTEEAQGALTKRDFVHCMNIAKKEARETAFWLKVWIAAKLPDHVNANVMLKEVEEIKNILTSIVKTAQKGLKL